MKLNVIEESDGWAIWLDTDGGEKDGVCVACAQEKRTAVTVALVELQDAFRELTTHI